MTIRVAINGFGRIGRNILRALFESNFRQHFELCAINDLGCPETLAHLTRYDSVHGIFPYQVSYHKDALHIDGQKIAFYSCAEAKKLPWRKNQIDLVFECTGRYTDGDKARAHIDAGAHRVLISAPAPNVDATIVYGVNHHLLTSDMQIISNASCTTNCLAPVAKVLDSHFGIERGLMTTIHAYTNDQQLTDEASQDLYRARAATQSIIPSKTGAAIAVGEVLPNLNGKLTGMAFRVPTINVSVVDFQCVLTKTASKEDINDAMDEASQGGLRGVMETSALPLVSIDYNHHPASAVFDKNQTLINENLVKVVAWYDNEWGFSNRMLDTGLAMMTC
ncbi:type I glyceraldehyde-3-phosphate dehydrogenase [Maricurvus nonylphenolicus]|uniref:type I glyceraldehyde-3-phosphate dehydrogenase n=1 Tax=Maricurvus nonylphenolicus TaxID=1008307 RepID=UPI0036F2733A